MNDLYPLGQPVRLSTTVKDDDDVLADPTGLTLDVAVPDGTTATKVWPGDVTRDSLGAFHIDLSGLAVAGHYTYTWTASGANAGVDTDVFDIFDPATYPRLVSFARAKAFARLKGTSDDDLFDQYIGWASAAILRRLAAALETVTETVHADGCLLLSRLPVSSVTSVTAVSLYAPTVSVADLRVTSALGGVVESVTSPGPCGTYTVVYVVGAAGVPVGADGACLTLIKHWWTQTQGHGSATYGDSGVLPDFADLPNTVLNMLAAAPKVVPVA